MVSFSPPASPIAASSRSTALNSLAKLAPDPEDLADLLTGSGEDEKGPRDESGKETPRPGAGGASSGVSAAKEALAVRDGLQPPPGGAYLATRADGPPSDRKPAAGEPTGQAVGRQPVENTGKKPHQPASSAPGRAAEVAAEPPQDQAEPGTTCYGSQRSEESSTRLLDAEAFLHSLGRDDARLSLPRHTARRLAPLAVDWLDTGLPRDQLRHTLAHGLAGARSTVALLRGAWRTPSPTLLPRRRPARALSRVSPACGSAAPVTRSRALFTPAPGSDDDLCPDCRTAAAEAPGDGPEPLDAPGFAAFLSAREVKRKQGRAR